MPAWLRRFIDRFLARRKFERAMGEEMRLHIDLHEESLVEKGLSRSEARRLARADFGSVAAAKDACRDARRFGRADALGREVRTSIRRLRMSPGFVVTAVTTLAVGLGANVLVFGALYGLLVKPLPLEAADRVTWIFSRNAGDAGDRQPLSSEEVQLIATRARSLAAIAVLDDVTLIRERPERFERWQGLAVTPSLFDVLRIGPVLGRGEPTLSGPQAILISHERWTRDFAADPAIVGRTLEFSDKKIFTVQGVLPAGLEFPFARSPLAGNGSGFVEGGQDFWILSAVRNNSWPGGVVISRLADSADVGTAEKELAALGAERAAKDPRRSLEVSTLRDQALGFLKPALPLIQMFALLLFAAACANLASLICARTVADRRQAGVRIALGATGRHLARLSAIEALLISGAGAAAALLIAIGGKAVLSKVLPFAPAQSSGPLGDWPPLLMLAGLTLVAVLLLAIVPGIVRSGMRPGALLDGAPRGVSPRSSRMLRTLVAAQLALSLVLLAGAGVLRASLHRLLGVDAGYVAAQVVTADVQLFVPNAQTALREIYQKVRSLPGVEALGVIHSTPLTGKWSIRDTIEIVEGDRRRQTSRMTGGFVAFDYFQAMGIDLVAGRYFTDDEAMQAQPRAVIINDLAARQYFPGGNAVGARLFMYGAFREVVGVVRATRDVRLDLPAEPQFYQPMFFNGSQIAARVAGDPSDYVEPIRRTLLGADPRLIVGDVRPLGDIVADRVRERQLAATLSSSFALLTVALAGLGLAGVLLFTIAGRRRELGVRAALGATPSSLAVLVGRDALGMVAAGLVAGAILFYSTGRLLRDLLFDVSAFDPLLLSGAVGGIVLAALIAALIPAWRAGKVDPVTALRS
jgi:predicted permease